MGDRIENFGHNLAMSQVQEAGIRDWDFPRGVASVALMVGFAREQGVAAGRILQGSGLGEKALGDPDAQIDAHTELAVIRNLVRELGRGRTSGWRWGGGIGSPRSGSSGSRV